MWTMIKRFYYDKFNINPMVIEYISVQDILKKCATGYSNKRIANSLNEDVNYISDTILEFFDFYGWEYDLDVNPLALYNRSTGDFERYRQEVSMVSSLVDSKLLELSFNICKRYNYIERIVRENYE